jgi:hypothetical protein
LEDVVMRRTSLGQFGPLPQVDQVADRMATLLNWDENRRRVELENLQSIYRTEDHI